MNLRRGSPWLLTVALCLGFAAGCERKPEWRADADNGWTEATQGRYAEAEQLLTRAAEQAQQQGQTGKPLAQITANLAWVYEKQSKHQEAAMKAEAARSLFKDSGSEPDVVTARCLFTLGKLYHARKKYADAEELYQQALAMGKDAKAFGPTHPVVGQIESELASLYDAQEKYSEAASHHAEAVRILDNASVQKEYSRIIACYESQAKHYRARGDFPRAAAAQEKALQVVKKSPLRKVDPDYIRVQQGLASLYAELGKYNESYKAYQEILESFHKNPPKNQLLIAQVKNDAGTLAYELRQYPAAKEYFEDALKIRRQELGDKKDLREASSLRSLGNLYKAQGKWSQAESHYLDALKIKEAVLGQDAVALAGDLDSLASVERKLNQHAKAEQLFQRSLMIRKKALGDEAPAVASAYHNLANFYRDRGKYADAETLYKKALAIKEKTLGVDHPQLAKLLDNYAAMLRADRRVQEAKQVKDRANALRSPKPERRGNG